MKFKDESSGATLHLDRYYGFADGGGLAGSFNGYDNQQQACIAIAADYELDRISTDPKELGAVQVCILSGQQFVDVLRTLGDLSEWGEWVED